jgi:hypothetical protein
MRTTLTIDPHVAKKFRERMAEKKLPLKRVVNDKLRASLSEKNRKHQAARLYLNRPMQVADAIRRVRVWLDRLRVEILTPGDRHAVILFDVLTGTGYRRRPHYGCAHQAALAIEYQGELVSTVADFARIPGLRWFNPLAPRRGWRRTVSTIACYSIGVTGSSISHMKKPVR